MMQDKYAYCNYLEHYGYFYKEKARNKTISRKSEKVKITKLIHLKQFSNVKSSRTEDN